MSKNLNKQISNSNKNNNYKHKQIRNQNEMNLINI